MVESIARHGDHGKSLGIGQHLIAGGVQDHGMLENFDLFLGTANLQQTLEFSKASQVEAAKVVKTSRRQQRLQSARLSNINRKPAAQNPYADSSNKIERSNKLLSARMSSR